MDVSSVVDSLARGLASRSTGKDGLKEVCNAAHEILADARMRWRPGELSILARGDTLRRLVVERVGSSGRAPQKG